MATTPAAHDASEQTSRTQPASRQSTLGLASRTDNLENRSALAPRTNRVAALATRARKGVAVARGYGPHAVRTPRQAAISAREQAEEQKRLEGMLLRRQLQEMKNTAKAKQAARLAQQHEMGRKRAEAAQRQRKDAAAAKKAARERETAAKANELQAKMREARELRECLAREAREKRRKSVAYKNAAWSRERELKKKLHEARQQEKKMAIDGRNDFIQAKERVRVQRELAEKRECVWRTRARKIEEARRYRRDGGLDQAALEKEAAEEKRLRRGSAQRRRNENMLELEIKRGSAEEALDATRLLADEVCSQEEDRKVQELQASRVTVSPEAQTSGESGGAVSSDPNGCGGVGEDGESYRQWARILDTSSGSSGSGSSGSSSGSSSSGMGIPGRTSIGSSLGSLVFQYRERPS